MKTSDLVNLSNAFVLERVFTNFPKVDEIIFIEEGHIGIIPTHRMVLADNPSRERICNKEIELQFCRKFLSQNSYNYGEFENGKYFEKTTVEMLLLFRIWKVSFIETARHERAITVYSLASAILEAVFSFYRNEYNFDEKVIEVVESGKKIKYSYEFFICYIKPYIDKKIITNSRIKRQLSENINENKYLCYSNPIQEIDILIKSLSRVKASL